MAATRSGIQATFAGEEASGLDEAFAVEQKVETENITEIMSEPVYMSGWKLHVLTFALCLGLFIVQMESSIVSTSIISITNELQGFEKSSWVFTGFLLTYSGLVIIWAKLSDIFGRKPTILLAFFIFIAFSGACGGAQTLIQLITFRCFQGLGGSGLFSISIIVFFEMVPPRKLPAYTSLVAGTFTFSVTFGPLIGGAISGHTTWRWIFLMNVPIGGISFVLFVLLLPARMPGQPSSTLKPAGANSVFSLKSLQRIDILGCVLLLGACMFIATALQLASESRSFSSAIVLSLLILSGAFWISFVAWQWFISTKRTYPEPVFPWRLLQSRVYMGMILNTFFAGTILTVLTIQLPQRFQTVNGDSNMAAGIRLIAFGLLAPAGSVLSAAIIGKTKIPPIYHILLGSILEVIGTTGLSRIPVTFAIAPSQYGWQVVTGLGVGFCNAPLMLLVNNATTKRDQAVGTAAITQFRVLGGILGLAIVISVMNRVIRSELLQVLPVETVDQLLQTTEIIQQLSESSQATVRAIFGKGYNGQMKILIGFAAAQLPSTALMWTKNPMMVEKK